MAYFASFEFAKILVIHYQGVLMNFTKSKQIGFLVGISLLLSARSFAISYQCQDLLKPQNISESLKLLLDKQFNLLDTKALTQVKQLKDMLKADFATYAFSEVTYLSTLASTDQKYIEEYAQPNYGTNDQQMRAGYRQGRVTKKTSENLGSELVKINFDYNNVNAELSGFSIYHNGFLFIKVDRHSALNLQLEELNEIPVPNIKFGHVPSHFTDFVISKKTIHDINNRPKTIIHISQRLPGPKYDYLRFVSLLRNESTQKIERITISEIKLHNTETSTLLYGSSHSMSYTSFDVMSL